MTYLLLKYLHVLGGIIILGTGTGIELEIPLSETWVAMSLALYLTAGVFWLPVVWVQRRMRDLAVHASASDEALPTSYYRLFRLWFIFGVPSFGAILAIIWLMIAKPSW